MQFSPGTLQQEKGAGWGLYSENICFDATFLQLFSLIVCKGIVELHGGTIRATSNGVGEGSCFSVELPVATGPIITNIEQAHPNAAATNPSTSQSRIAMSLLTRSFMSFSTCMGSIICNGNAWNFRPDFSYVAGKVERASTQQYTSELILTPNLSLNGRTCESNSGTSHEENDMHIDALNSINFCNIRSGCNDKDDATPLDSNKPLNSMKQGRVLIVDDVAMNRKMLRRLLIARFDECDEAENGQQAVDMAKRAMALGLCYDIITMDYQMPIMDGVTATRCIRKLGYKGQIIGVTGNALQEDVATFVENGANIVLTKPLSISKFDEYLCNVS